ncbi:head maturation protease, ClpP-related [Liquorilactobacillus mali]|uniref:head maturation protease, ClpP-related n=1 Tax=Liquorilactobacillus mali TaxID=1618 RepID=UPI002955B5E2|nr:head maturation protease, ClpP-related [Liquorilactobacillus mali]MDV7758252.1 Clp protease ClpP [Liquorilactobacillus mali]
MTKQVMIKSDIVDDQTAAFYQFFGMSAVSPSGVADILNDGDGNEDVEVDVASNGGDVFAASEIYTMLKAYQGNVTVNIQGLAASAASVISMAGDKVNISPTAQIMIHKAWSQPAGNADDLEHEANILNGIDQSIASAYEAKTGMKQSDLLQLMSNETWLTAQDAVDKGFADEIMFVDDKQLQPVNAISHIPPKSAVNKLLNLIRKADRTKPTPLAKPKDVQEKNKINNSQPVLNDKLAILFGKKEGMLNAKN